MSGRHEPKVLDVPCPLCRGRDVTPVLRDAGAAGMDRPSLVACTSLDHGTFGQIVACKACGIRFRSPREDDATILAYYQRVEDPVYTENEPARVLTFARALRRLETRVPVRGPLLDVGCYTGVFLDAAAARGWPAAGIEPSEWAAAAARTKGHRVHCGTLETAPFERDSFAVVTMWDALEHYADPVKELRLARGFARDDGYLVLSTMNVDAWLPRLLRSRWPWYMRMHLAYFTPAALAAGLARAGWTLVHVHGYTHVVTWDYLLLKLGRYLPGVNEALRRLVRVLGCSHRTVPVNLGDFMTAYARKAPAGSAR